MTREQLEATLDSIRTKVLKVFDVGAVDLSIDIEWPIVRVPEGDRMIGRHTGEFIARIYIKGPPDADTLPPPAASPK